MQSSPKTTDVVIPPALLAALDALPDPMRGPKGYQWTAGEDAALLEYWPRKRKADVAKALGIAQGACLKRYKELTDEG